jgi:hypothetical protein
MLISYGTDFGDGASSKRRCRSAEIDGLYGTGWTLTGTIPSPSKKDLLLPSTVLVYPLSALYRLELFLGRAGSGLSVSTDEEKGDLLEERVRGGTTFSIPISDFEGEGGGGCLNGDRGGVSILRF